MILSSFSFGNRRKYNGITINVGIKITHIIIKRVRLFQNPFLFLWNNFHATIGLQIYLVGRYLYCSRGLNMSSRIISTEKKIPGQ